MHTTEQDKRLLTSALVVTTTFSCERGAFETEYPGKTYNFSTKQHVKPHSSAAVQHSSKGWTEI